ncbi:MAG: hypothetical protein Q9169_005228 [Polycauliona sp. 2 TL-2023]
MEQEESLVVETNRAIWPDCFMQRRDRWGNAMRFVCKYLVALPNTRPSRQILDHLARHRRNLSCIFPPQKPFKEAAIARSPVLKANKEELVFHPRKTIMTGNLFLDCST